MLSCKRVTALIEMKSELNLNTTQHTQIFIHTRFCKSCKLYKKQSGLIDKALGIIISEEVLMMNKPVHRLSVEIKKDILCKIETS